MKPVFTSDTFISETEVKEAISIPKVYREPVDETEPQETILTKITMFESDSTTLTNRNTIPSMCGDSKVTTFDNSVVPTSSKGIANGVASLDSTGKIPTSTQAATVSVYMWGE